MLNSAIRRRQACAALLALCTFGSDLAHAQATPLSKAEALVDKALATLKSQGKDAALAEFNKPDGAFVDGELYIYAYDLEGNCLALGANPKLVGKNLIELKSSNGIYQIKELIAQIKAKGVAHVEAEFTNPLTKKVQPKVLVAKRVPGADMFVGSGVYK
ncbi:cache domain-containing protein [Curvibacter sp. HBC61]|uniref:Cache domain-containing protein n=1 Tax=Curvibacter cyanobacteriorum TaxID=3026422 RepID=A0ABT5N3Y9_9BURK|nr:cache domain-containing protein [Curvibacter sp. HBC61]MDD0840763.1 cache domain-containing protein [Curvibacter sp. HBC61]